MANDHTDAPQGTNSRKSQHLRAVQQDGATPIVLAPAHLEDLQSSGLSEETIAAAGLYSESKSAPVAEVLGWSWRGGGGLIFPFTDYDSGKLITSRVKPDRPRIRSRGGKERAVKYEQAPGTGAVPYFGPRLLRDRWLDDLKRPLLWTEGEKKTLLLDQLGYTCIGLTGCHNFNDGQANRDGNGIVWAPKLRKYGERHIKGRAHVIVYDSDAFVNNDVMLAMRRLAGLLLESGASSVRYVRIPGDPKNETAGIGIDDHHVAHGEASTRALIDASELIAVGEDVSPIAPKDPLVKLGAIPWLKAARVAKDLRLPPRFEIRRDLSLWLEPPLDKTDAEAKEIMRSVILPTRVVREHKGEEERLEIAYSIGGRWHRATVDRRALRDARRALAELPPAVAIDSNSAAAVVLWIGEYLRTNEHRFHVKQFATTCGWYQADDEPPVFLASETYARKHSVLIPDAEGERADMISALTPRGDCETHRETLQKAFHADPICAMAILGALSAPLLKPLGAPSFAIHLPGESSRGKTSMLKIAASVFGDPRSEHWIGSWNCTQAAMEARAHRLCDLPLPFDEIQASEIKALEKAVYMLTNGIGRARGNVSQTLRKTLHWRIVVMSTGEHELVLETANTGAQVRVLQWRVKGFGTLGAAQVDALREACERHHGHVGAEWLQALVDIEDWAPFIEVYEALKREFREAATDPLMARQAVYYALMALAEHVASDLLGIGSRSCETVRKMYLETGQKRMPIQTAPERAIEFVSAWISSDLESFPALGMTTGGKLVAPKMAGSRRLYGVRHRGHVYILPSELRVRITNEGLSHSEVLAAWRDNGTIVCDAGRTDTRLKWGDKRTRVVAIRCEDLGMDHAIPEPPEDVGDFND